MGFQAINLKQEVIKMLTSILSNSIKQPLFEVIALLGVQYTSTRHFDVRMHQRGITPSEISNIIDTKANIGDSAKAHCVKGFLDGLVYVYELEGNIKKMVTCYRSKKKKYNT